MQRPLTRPFRCCGTGRVAYLSKSEHRGEADRARAILLMLEGRRAEEIAVVLCRRSAVCYL